MGAVESTAKDGPESTKDAEQGALAAAIRARDKQMHSWTQLKRETLHQNVTCKREGGMRIAIIIYKLGHEN